MDNKMHKEMPKKEMPKASDMDMQKMHKEMGTEHKKEHQDKISEMPKPNK